MERRTVLATTGSLLCIPLVGCLRSTSKDMNHREKHEGDVGTVPVAFLEMKTVTDTEIARRVTYRIDYEHQTSERELAGSAIENGSTTVTATNRPFPENRPFVYDATVYELSSQVVESEPATQFRVTLDPAGENVPDEEAIRYEDLPDVDKAVLWEDVDTLGIVGMPVIYGDADIPESVLVPEPEYSVIVWDAETRGQFTVENSSEIELKTFEYTVHRVHESAERFGREIRDDFEVLLSDLTTEEEAIVSVAIESRYSVSEAGPPEAFNLLAERFSGQASVHRVYDDLDDNSQISGEYIVRYDNDVYWTKIFISESLPDRPTDNSTDTPTDTPSDTPTDTPTESFDPTEHVADWQDERVRGEADLLETEGSIESWSVIDVKCGKVGRDALQAVVSNRIDNTSSLSFGFGKDMEDDRNGYRISVSRILHLDRDGEIQRKPDVSFASLREATSRAVRATVTHDHSEHTCEYPVYVSDRVLQED